MVKFFSAKLTVLPSREEFYRPQVISVIGPISVISGKVFGRGSAALRLILSSFTSIAPGVSEANGPVSWFFKLWQLQIMAILAIHSVPVKENMYIPDECPDSNHKRPNHAEKKQAFQEVGEITKNH